ncbi:hypothetical protein UPYG_G00115290 [Umbra pygmaea]|uniref:HMG box domain-containing protein n=1 Tax=Umbra pygmaea TaxID=75934 RepID=A0ABD0X3Z6_UMBPY
MPPKEKSKPKEKASYGAPGKRGKKVKKDPNAPKRPPSGFFVFCAEQRPKIKAQHPSFGIGDVAKKLGEMWNNLTDSNKQPYLAKAKKLKEKYQKDVADYKSGKGKPSGAGASKSKKADDDDDEEEEDEDDDENEDEDD